MLVSYFNVVFTLPDEVCDIVLQGKAAIHGLLFRAAFETITTIATDPNDLGARMGITAVLHTHGRGDKEHGRIREGVVHANFSIHADAARRTMAITFRGFWSMGVVDAYCAERAALVQNLSGADCSLSLCVMLVDARDLKAQPLDSVDAFAKRIGGPTDQPKLSALLVASALFTLQGQRMAIPNQRLFTDRAEAMAWLGWPAG